MKKVLYAFTVASLALSLMLGASAFEVANPNNEDDFINNPLGVIEDTLPTVITNESSVDAKLELVSDALGREGSSGKISFTEADGTFRYIKMQGFHWHIVGNNAFEFYMKKTAANDDGKFFFFVAEGGGTVGTWETFKLDTGVKYLAKGTDKWVDLEIQTEWNGDKYVVLPANFDGWLHIEGLQYAYGGTGDMITTFNDNKLAGNSFACFTFGGNFASGDTLVFDDFYAVNALGANINEDINPVKKDTTAAPTDASADVPTAAPGASGTNDDNVDTGSAVASVAAVAVVAAAAAIITVSKKRSH